jgi:tellurite resistance protein TehA-like permease
MLVFSLIIFFLNLFLFVFFSILLVAKYICYPDRWSALIQNPVTSLYTGCFPMAATTLINVGVQVVNAEYNVGGKDFLYFLWAVWWVVVVVSFTCCWAGVHAMYVVTSVTMISADKLV